MKTSRVFIYAGAALLLVALMLFIWNAIPTISSRLYTRSIPTAPLFSPLLDATTPDAEGMALLPFEPTSGTPVTPMTIPLASDATPLPTTATPTQPTSFTTATPNPTPTPLIGAVPSAINIPLLDLDAPVVPIGVKTVTVNGSTARMWNVPNYRAVGWHETSSSLGLPGNTVLNGHNTSSGEVFRDLYKVPVGGLVIVRASGGQEFAYRVKEKYILPEAGQPLDVRLQNALYVQETPDERLTLVTCHPYGSLANRLIVIAVPAPPKLIRGEE